jgi:pimeloyl-ACP methyl ester carboxylesterase
MSLYAEEIGTGHCPTIVFLHGLITSGWMWQQQTQQLQDFHCLVPDLPQHGHSRYIVWRSIKETARQVADLIRQRACAGRAHLVGLSLGSLIALQVMRTTPDLVGRVLLSGTNILPVPARMKLSNLILLPFLKTRYFVGLASTSLRLSPEASMLYRESVRQMSYLAMWRITQQSASFRVERNSKLSTAPVLIVAGQMEHPLVLQSMKLLLTTLPYSCGYLAPGGRHGWIGESTDLFNQLQRAWFGKGPLPPELIPVEP